MTPGGCGYHGRVRLRALIVGVICAILVGCAPLGSADATTRAIGLALVASHLDRPVYVTEAPNDTSRLFIVQQGGLIRILQNGRMLATPFLNLTRSVSKGNEQGLLSMAFDPRYGSDGRFFVSVTDPAGDSQLIAYHVLPDHRNIANPFTRRVLLTIHQPYANHNGGMIAFGRDGNLYYGLGDGGSEGDPNLNGQKRTGFLSKILRINVSGATPRVSIYAYGLRNPWRFSFDRVTGTMWIGDVGQDRYEEIDRLGSGARPGTNFGWSYYEGDHVYKVQPINRSRLVFPVAEYPHNPGGNCAVTGGYVYRGTDIPFLYGWYVFGDFCSGRVWKMQAPSGRPQPMAFSGKVREISSFGQGARGGLFLVSLSGSVYRLVET